MRIDCHNDTALFLREQRTLDCLPQAQLDWQRFRQHLDLAFFAIFIDQGKYPGRETAEYAAVLKLLLADIAAQPDVQVLRTRAQLQTAASGKLALISMEGATPLGGQGQHLDEFFAAGLRAVGLTWNYPTPYAGDNTQGGGLTSAGRDLVRRCNELGVLLDAAHGSSRTLRDLLRWSSRPVIDSHTVCGGVCPRFARAISDADLQALAAHGGVAGMTMVPDFLGGVGDMDQLCCHIEYAVRLVGSEHVALGADYDGTEMHEEYRGVEKRPLVLERLRQRGMSEADLANVDGESARRLLLQVLPQ